MAWAEQDLSRNVPGLKFAFVYRDNWTCLNVRPAKIMQVPSLFNFIYYHYHYFKFIRWYR